MCNKIIGNSKLKARQNIVGRIPSFLGFTEALRSNAVSEYGPILT
jgi:hypothetical protein